MFCQGVCRDRSIVYRKKGARDIPPNLRDNDGVVAICVCRRGTCVVLRKHSILRSENPLVSLNRMMLARKTAADLMYGPITFRHYLTRCTSFGPNRCSRMD